MYQQSIRAFLETNKKIKRKCYICSNGHKTIDCPTLKTIPNKNSFSKSRKLFTHCANHRWNQTTQCRLKATIKCDICLQSCLQKQSYIIRPHQIRSYISVIMTNIFGGGRNTSDLNPQSKIYS